MSTWTRNLATCPLKTLQTWLCCLYDGQEQTWSCWRSQPAPGLPGGTKWSLAQLCPPPTQQALGAPALPLDKSCCLSFPQDAGSKGSRRSSLIKVHAPGYHWRSDFLRLSSSSIGPLQGWEEEPSPPPQEALVLTLGRAEKGSLQAVFCPPALFLRPLWRECPPEGASAQFLTPT